MCVSEHMRVATNHFINIGCNHILDGEPALFFGNARMEHDLKQQVAKFFLDFIGRPFIQSFHDFVALFDEKRLERLRGLLAVPWAAIGTAEFGHKIHECSETVTHVYSLISVPILYSTNSFVPYTNRFLFA